MARVITFSRYFQKTHPRAGEPTYFVEALYHSLYLMKTVPKELEETFSYEKFSTGYAKHHTIRAGNRFKKGDYFSPRVWSGKPYKSKQIVLAPDTEIKNVWNFEIKNEFQADGWYNFFYLDGKFKTWDELEIIAMNDGLPLSDMVHWFKANDGYFSGKENLCNFIGQVICWNDKVNY